MRGNNISNSAVQDELPMMSIRPSVLFPGRVNLYPWEAAKALCCTKEQIINLIEIGKMGAVDISSSRPKKVRKGRHCASVRRHWRVPVSELEDYIGRNNNIALAED